MIMEEIINLGASYMNAYLLALDEGYCLIDTGYPFDRKNFLRKAKKKGIELTEIKYIVITHVHADHVGFLKYLLDSTNATLICTSDHVARLKTGINEMDVYISDLVNLITSKFSVAFKKITQCFEPVEYDKVVDPMTQPLIDQGLDFFLLKVHTSSDLCVKYKDIIFCGDVCMNGMGSKVHSPMWIEDNAALADSWEILSNREESTLYPAHGKPFERSAIASLVEAQRNRKIYKLYK